MARIFLLAFAVFSLLVYLPRCQVLAQDVLITPVCTATAAPTSPPYIPPTSPPGQGTPPVSGAFETTLILLSIGAFSAISGVTTFLYSSKFSKK